MKTVLIIGATSFIGNYLAIDLTTRGGIQVVAIARKAPSNLMNNPNIICREIDIDDQSQLISIVEEFKPNAVINLVAQTFVQHDIISDFYYTNVVLALRLVEAMNSTKHKVDAFIHFSTAGVYGRQTMPKIPENATFEFTSHYGLSKQFAETVLKRHEGKIKISIVRPFNVYGESQRSQFLIPKIMSHFVSQKPTIELGALDPVRDYIHVSDVSKIIGRMVELDIYPDTLNICTGHGSSVADILNYLREITGHNIEVIVNPKFLRSDEINSLVGSVEILRNLGFDPDNFIQFREGLKLVLANSSSNNI